jgi:hypothetical protein
MEPNLNLLSADWQEIRKRIPPPEKTEVTSREYLQVQITGGFPQSIWVSTP